MAAIAQMAQSSRAAAQILIRHGARAATDVTGFGLIGHLAGMLEAGGVDARLDLDRLPVLDGARETMAAGILSSLHPQNAERQAAVMQAGDWEEHPLYPLLSDPQTAGGLLAAVPAHEAAACLAGLVASGYGEAAIIGEVTVRAGVSSAVMLGEALNLPGST